MCEGSHGNTLNIPPCPCCRVREGGKTKIWMNKMFSDATFKSTCSSPCEVMQHFRMTWTWRVQALLVPSLLKVYKPKCHDIRLIITWTFLNNLACFSFVCDHWCMPHVSIFIQKSSIYRSIEIKQVTLPIKLIPLLGFLLVVFKAFHATKHEKIKSTDPRKFYPRCVNSLLVSYSLTLKATINMTLLFSIFTTGHLTQTTHAPTQQTFLIKSREYLVLDSDFSLWSAHFRFQPVNGLIHLIGSGLTFW